MRILGFDLDLKCQQYVTANIAKQAKE